MSTKPFRLEVQLEPYADGSGSRYTVVVKRDQANEAAVVVIKSLGEDLVIEVDSWFAVSNTIAHLIEFAADQDARLTSAPKQG